MFKKIEVKLNVDDMLRIIEIKKFYVKKKRKQGINASYFWDINEGEVIKYALSVCDDALKLNAFIENGGDIEKWEN